MLRVLCFSAQSIGDAEDIYSSVSGNTFWHRLGFIFFRSTARAWIQRLSSHKKFLDKPGKIVRIVFATHAIIISYFAIQESSRKSLYAFDGLICVGQKQIPSFWQGPKHKWGKMSLRAKGIYMKMHFVYKVHFHPKGALFLREANGKNSKWPINFGKFPEISAGDTIALLTFFVGETILKTERDSQ